MLFINSKKELEVKLFDKVVVAFSKDVYEEIFAYTDAFETEVSGCGMVDMVRKPSGLFFIVDEVFLPNQKNSSAYTDIAADEIHKLIVDLVSKGEDTSRLRFHWHSHVNMDTFHSGTDEENYRDLKTGDFLVSVVVNKSRDMLARIDFYKPFEFTFIGLPACVLLPESAGLAQKVKDSIDRVKEFDKPIGYNTRWDEWDKDTKSQYFPGMGSSEHERNELLFSIIKKSKRLIPVKDAWNCVVGVYDKHTRRNYCIDLFDCNDLEGIEKKVEKESVKKGIG